LKGARFKGSAFRGSGLKDKVKGKRIKDKGLRGRVSAPPPAAESAGLIEKET